jgi:predicted small lipoprotein YifL
LTAASRVVGNAHGAAARRRGGRAASSGALLLGMVLVAGCGQRGPLSLPDSARPIERLDPSAQPAQPAGSLQGVAEPAPAAAAGSTPPAQREPVPEEQQDPNKPRRPENER